MKQKSYIILFLPLFFLIVSRFIFALPSAAPTSGSGILFSNGTSPSTTTNLTLNYLGSTIGSFGVEMTGGSSLKLGADATTGLITIPNSSNLYFKSANTRLLSLSGSTGDTSTIGATDLVFKGVIKRGAGCEKVAFPWKRSGGVITLQDSAKKVFFGSTFTSSFTPKVQINGTTQLDNDLFVTKGYFNGLFSDKAYESSNLNDLNARRGRVWGQGRVTTSDLINSAGECSRTLTLLNADGTNSATTNSVKLSRSKVLVSWDGAGAGCPKNWWVCSKAERGTAACGATQATIPNFYIINCSAYTWLTASGTPLPAGVDLLTSTVDDGYAWLADPYNTAALNANGFNEGSAINQAGTLYAAADVDNVTVAGGSTRVLNQYGDLCYYRPVWCCSY